MMRAPHLGLLVLVALLALGSAPAAADSKVVLAPLSTLGEETKSKSTRAVHAAIETALGTVPGIAVIDDKALERALRKVRRPELRVCDGETKCLAQLGTVVGADVVVYGELGGLGDAQVVYLKAVDVAKQEELRSTTLELGAKVDQTLAARGAAYRLLAPDGYTGTLTISVDVEGASVYVDGRPVGASPAQSIRLPVGTHALRVTHPEFRDFVRFVEVGFDADTAVEAGMQQFPIVSTSIRSTGRGANLGSTVVYKGQEPTPWYREWYAVAGASAVVLVGSAILVGVLVDGLSVDSERKLSSTSANR
ncbi:MAG TPA: PEGA domain-containing protein [Kofleriaceae bacterium]|nr:PEGA domain-containing protein [Kofleriaceae bacterium]